VRRETGDAEVRRARGNQHRPLGGADRVPGSRVIAFVTWLLALLGAGLMYISFDAQYRFIFAQKGDRAAPVRRSAERELCVQERRWAGSVRAIAGLLSATGRWLAAGRLDSHLGGARTLILPGRNGPAARESAWKKSASESSLGGPACH